MTEQQQKYVTRTGEVQEPPPPSVWELEERIRALEEKPGNDYRVSFEEKLQAIKKEFLSVYYRL